MMTNRIWNKRAKRFARTFPGVAWMMAHYGGPGILWVQRRRMWWIERPAWARSRQTMETFVGRAT